MPHRYFMIHTRPQTYIFAPSMEPGANEKYANEIVAQRLSVHTFLLRRCERWLTFFGVVIPFSCR